MSRELFWLGAIAPLAVVSLAGQPLDGSGGRTAVAGVGSLTNRDLTWIGAAALVGLGLGLRGERGDRALSAGLGFGAAAMGMKTLAMVRGEPLLPQA